MHAIHAQALAPDTTAEPESVAPKPGSGAVAHVLGLIEAYRASVPVYVATRLGLPDLLREGARTAEELARATGTHPPALRRLLRAMAALGLVDEDAAGAFHTTEEGRTLERSGALWGLSLLMGGEHYRVWGEVLASVRTGRPSFVDVWGLPVPEYLAQHPEIATAYDACMTGLTDQTIAATLDAYDISGLGCVVDVGGGRGSLVEAILRANPRATGVVLELPHVAEHAARRFAASRLDGRASAQPGDFRRRVPPGGDLYVVSRVLQGLEDADATALMRRCAEQLHPHGRVLVGEMVMTGENERITTLEDLHMLVVTPGGRIRSEGEHRRLFAEARLEVTRVIHCRTPIPYSLIEGRRAADERQGA